jgi:ribosomal protein S18 acetylase RimI-like enzyme
VTAEPVVIRRADVDDVDDIADAHRDSIQSLGAAFYDPAALAAWQAGISGDLYRGAMKAGEVFFIATGTLDGRQRVLGFSSDYAIEGPLHGTSVYVRGGAARRGIGRALLQRAEGHAVARGATSIRIEASLAGVEFYKASGYEEVSRGETRLTSGHVIGCVFMRKPLGVPAD